MKILFISHDATLTGAPILLLNLIKLLKADYSCSIKIVLKNGSGSLVKDFESAGELLIWKKTGNSNLLRRIKKRLSTILTLGKANDRKIQRWIDESDIVFTNTVTNGDFLRSFDFSKSSNVISY